VATNGNDNNSGSAAAPFTTLAHAVAIASSSSTKTIYMRGGQYFQSGISLGSAASGLRLLGYPGETADLSGGTPITDWVQGANNVWTATTTLSSIDELNINGVKQTQARYPHQDACNPRYGGWLFAQSGTGNTITFKAGDLTSNQIGPGGKAYIMQGGYDDILTVSSVDFSTNVITFTTSSSRFGSIPAGAHYFIFNNPHLLASPGEWYFDPSSHTLTYMGDGTFNGTGAIASNIETEITINGASNVTIQGLEISDLDSHSPSDSGPGAIEVTGGVNLMLDNNLFRNTGIAVDLVGGSGAVIENNEIGPTYKGAIMAAVFFSSITNNYIHDTGWWYGHAAAIHLSGLSGSLIVTHNTIWSPAHWGIAYWSGSGPFGGSVLGYNIVDNANWWEGWDSGAIYIEYAGQLQTLGRDTMEYNSVTNSTGHQSNADGTWLLKQYAHGFYLDDGTSEWDLIGNFSNVCSSCIYFHNGTNNTATNNLCTGNDQYGLKTTAAGTSNVLNHNIFDAPTGVAGSVTSTSNDFWGGASKPSGDSGSTVANPQYTSPCSGGPDNDTYCSGNYALQPGSAAFSVGYQELPWSQMGVQ
jgi:Right handed beta helix region